MSDQVQRELGTLTEKIEAQRRELGDIKKRFAEFLEEERREHKAINAGITDLKALLDVHLATSRHSRRTLTAVAGTIGAGATALALKIWDLISKGHSP